MDQTMKIWLPVPFGVAMSTIHFWKADILHLLENPIGRVKVIA